MADGETIASASAPFGLSHYSDAEISQNPAQHRTRK